MWQYNRTEDMYVGKYDDNNSLIHYGVKGMKWGKKKAQIQKETGGFNDGVRNRQSWTSYTNKSSGNNVTLVKGSNKDNKYVGVSVGKPTDNYKYKEKSIKVGKYTVNYDNENGQHNISLHVDHNKKKQRTAQGKSILAKLFGKK